jgi:hypothetical protein
LAVALSNRRTPEGVGAVTSLIASETPVKVEVAGEPCWSSSTNIATTCLAPYLEGAGVVAHTS